MPKSKHQIPGSSLGLWIHQGASRPVLQPISNRAQEDVRLLRLIRASFVASQGIYGVPRVFLDLREAGETCSMHRVARLMREANLRALHGHAALGRR